MKHHALPGHGPSLHPADAKLLRVWLTYVLPALAVLYVVVAGLWLVPDGYLGMYGNYDGHWASWNARGILEWGRFFDFSPFSPLSGTGSVFLPNLPWLNPAALALAIPAPLPLTHLASMLVYLAELAVSLYLLYRHLEFSREQSFLATILYICIFFIPFNGYTLSLFWYALAPVNAHLITAMNVATIALIRVGRERLAFKLLFGLVFIAAIFVAFASAPISMITYIPVFGLLWLAFLIPFQAERSGVLWRWGVVAGALSILALIGAPSYQTATALTSARGDAAPPIFHQGWLLLSPDFWLELAASYPLCLNEIQLMCPSAIIGWFEIASLVGGLCLAFACPGTKRRYGVVIVLLLVSIHFYALLSLQQVLGKLHVISTPYLMWAFFPLAPPSAIAAAGFAGRLLLPRRAAMWPWMPSVASWLIALAAIVVWVEFIQPSQPRLPGRGVLGLPPIAHVPVNEGPIVNYLRQHIGLRPGSEFRGYAATFLGAHDGLVRKATNTPGETMTWRAYVAARELLFDRFGNSFQTMDLWNSRIPTFEEYGQWTSKQMYLFTRDLLAEPEDGLDLLMSSTLVYRFRPLLLRALGVRFVIADGTLSDPIIKQVVTEAGKGGATANLYEIKDANLGQFSPTHVMWAADYNTAVKILREPIDLKDGVVLLGLPERQPELVSASRSRLVAISDGYHLTASAPRLAMLVLPLQFSHCWQIETAPNVELPRIFRANIVQTGILFKDNVDVRLYLDFDPWKASCRFEDARDLELFGFK
jgi:hypothetical protein